MILYSVQWGYGWCRILRTNGACVLRTAAANLAAMPSTGLSCPSGSMRAQNSTWASQGAGAENARRSVGVKA